MAKEDLLKLRKYIQEEFDKKTANDSMKNLLESIKKFSEFPLLGRPLTNIIDMPTEYMYYVAGKNYVFYRLEERSVKVIRILDTRQDYVQILFDHG